MRESQHLTAKADDAEFVEFFRAGDHATGEFECVACRHRGLQVGELSPCPACGGALWERSAWAPFGRVLSALAERLH